MTTLCTLLLSVAAQAQNTMVVHLTNGTSKQIEVEKIDSMTWENATTLHIFMKDKTTTDYAVGQVANLTWLVTSTPEPPITNGDVSLGTGEAFYISDEMTDVRAANCALHFSPTVVDELTKLVVRTATSVPQVKIEGTDPDELVGISQNAVAIDADLGGIHELDGFVEIRIPLSIANGSVPGVAWYNETTKQWEPIDYDYDTRTHEAVIYSNHLSTFEAYEIKDEHTRNARLNFYEIPYIAEDTPLEEIAHMIEDGAKATVDWTDFASTWWGNFSSFGLDMTYSAFKSCGLEHSFLEKHNEQIGKIGTMFACYDILRAGLSGDHQTAGLNTMKLMIGKITSALTDAVSSSIMTAGMCSVAILDYALNQMWEQSWSDRQDLYRRCYERYYQSSGADGLVHHPIRPRQWYNILLPEFTKGAPTVDGVKQAVQQILDDYVWEYWNLPDDEQILYWQAVGGPAYSYTGGLSQALKKELADNHKAELANDVLPPIFEAIGREMRFRNYDILHDHMKEYAKLMNQVVRFDIQDGTAVTASQYDGCTVRFKDLPATIQDPQKWQVTLNSLGKGTIRFRIYPYVTEGVQPVLEVVNKGGEVIKELPVVIAPGATTVELGEGAQKGFLLKEMKVVSYANDPESVEKTVYIHCTEELGGYDMDIEWPIWLNFAGNSSGGIDYIFADGIKDAFAKHPNLSVDTEGNFGITSEALTIQGTLDSAADPKSGSGTFSVNSSFFCQNKTKAQIEQMWHGPFQLDNTNLFMNGQVEHQISGTFSCEWSDEKQLFVFTFTGEGPSKVTGEYWNNCSGYDYNYSFGNMPEFQVNGTNNFTAEGTTAITLTVDYELNK